MTHTPVSAGKRPSAAHAAVWVPDTESKLCMHCNKAQFTVINRRHHCRNCGLVICGNCSKNKFLIPSQSSKPVRVCDTCFTELCKRRVSAAPDPGPGDESTSPASANGSAAVAASVPIDDVSVEEHDIAAESSDSDDESADPLENATANLSVEDEKPIFYAEVPAEQGAASSV